MSKLKHVLSSACACCAMRCTSSVLVSVCLRASRAAQCPRQRNLWSERRSLRRKHTEGGSSIRCASRLQRTCLSPLLRSVDCFLIENYLKCPPQYVLRSNWHNTDNCARCMQRATPPSATPIKHAEEQRQQDHNEGFKIQRIFCLSYLFLNNEQ